MYLGYHKGVQIFGLVLLMSLFINGSLGGFLFSSEEQDWFSDSNSDESISFEHILLPAIKSGRVGGRIWRRGCYCINGPGTYCGSTKSIGQISGDCSEHDLYYCSLRRSSAGVLSLSKWVGKCQHGCYSTKDGQDYCK